MMQQLNRSDLLSLEDYAAQRTAFRDRVMAHKRARALAVGPHVTLLFEDRLTIRYQVQEMLRTERLFEPAEIEQELDVYNPLIPDGSNWKATMMIEYPDERERRAALVRLAGIEHRVWARVAGHAPVFAIADEDLERGDAHKTSAVHFLRLELDPAAAAAVREGAAITVGVDHPAYRHAVDPIPEPLRRQLAGDLVAASP